MDLAKRILLVLNGLWSTDMNIFFEMDADFSHNPNDLPKLYDALEMQI